MADTTNTETEKTMGMVLGCAIKVIASTCVAMGDNQRALDLARLYRDEKWDELAASLEALAASGRHLPR